MLSNTHTVSGDRNEERPMFQPSMRGYHAVYREHETNHCPGCGRTHWHIGRMTAECAFCSTALPLQSSLTRGTPAPVIVDNRGRQFAVAA